MDPQFVAGRFRLRGIIDRGNMGEVHRAEDTSMPADSAEREVAVKLLLRRRSGLPVDPDDSALRRFAREVEMMRRLAHLRIPRIIDWGVDSSDGSQRPYLAMELLDGRTLRDLTDEEPWVPAAWVVAIGAQIADALCAAHAKSIVHRDLKPTNVMVTRGGLVKVLDFGMGRIVDDPSISKVTSTDATVGTVRYMAPEQFEGAEVTPAADLYALGCVLYELLCGAPPFDGDTLFELGDKHNNHPVPPLGPQRRGIPTGLNRLIEQLLKKRPRDRPGNAAEVRQALSALDTDSAEVIGWADFDPRAYPPVPEPATLLEDTAVHRSDHATRDAMDVFSLHEQLIGEYREFTGGGVVIRADDVAAHLREDMERKSQWPDPRLSLNPFFASGRRIDELVTEGVLHPETARIFQTGKKTESTVCDAEQLVLHRHQREAIEVAHRGESYVLTTGTGSGKSLGYIVPIVDRVLRAREQERSQESERPSAAHTGGGRRGGGRRGRVRAIIVYPMNALANSQLEELRKFLVHGYGEGREPVTFARYTGQESDERRREIQSDPPDILLTNYVMLELMLTRPKERARLIKMAHGLDFLVFDELHTYRGRQGADVAMLIRRVRQACETPNVQCVGTSATMSSQGTAEIQRSTVAGVATSIFGTEVRPDNVITETLVRATAPGAVTVPAGRITDQDAPRTYQELHDDSLARWIESTFGLTTDLDGRLVRRLPITVETAARCLSRDTAVPEERCVEAIRRTLEAGAEAIHPTNGRPLFAFRLHQFLSKGDTVHTTLEPPGVRYLTREYETERPGHDGHVLLPLSFCRDCGQEYLTVWRKEARTGVVYQARRDTVADSTNAVEGYLYISTDNPWPESLAEVLATDRLPESWVELDDDHQPNVRKNRRGQVPELVTVDVAGNEGRGELSAAFVPAPFRFCLHCGVSYDNKRGTKDFAQLSSLGQEGRSSATSLISGTVVRTLKSLPPDALSPQARKLLTFVDNRQDASLQAGHFNDFAQVVELRSGLYRALKQAGEDGLSHEELASSVTHALELDPADYVKSADIPPSQAKRAATVLRDVIAFRLSLDLERGWRVTMPNLEQTGLLRVDYADLEWIAGAQERWARTTPELRDAAPEIRVKVLRVLLDEMRRALAIDTPYFRDETFESVQLASERLTDAWALNRNDRPRVTVTYPRPSRGGSRNGLFLSGRGKFAKYLARTYPEFEGRKPDDLQEVITDLMKVLAKANLVSEVTEEPHRPRFHRRDSPAETGYQVNAACLIWRAGDGQQGTHDPVNRTYPSGEGPAVNQFFRDLYRGKARSLAGLTAAEHTAQVAPEIREERERLFSDAELKLLYCSPTMELGVDIKDLNAVMMRNVPPTPASYAQRSGRAGRGGQPALVITYCATGNSHDQYYFRRPELMVSGVVAPPRLDLTNEDLAVAHVQAIWLAETDLLLGRAVPEVVSIAYDEEQRVPAPALPLHDRVGDEIGDEAAQRRTIDAAREVIADVPGLRETAWWDDAWLERVIRRAPERFDRAFDRWRELFRAALIDQAEQNRRVLDHSLSERDRARATNRRREAETQILLLKNESQDSKSLLSDFNPYRYLASQGFLPGYSFPRLPLAAYIPTRRSRFDEGHFLQRPRFVAVREFGPGALIYHEGARYQVTRIQLPPEASGELSTSRAARCPRCGYHHPEENNTDRCELCDHSLSGAATTGLLQLHTVYTTKRERISSDEEERRRAGFRLVTSYRFQSQGERLGRQDAVINDDRGTFAHLHYGDSATVRVTNLGRLRARSDEPDGFWLDPVTGKWLNEQDAAKAAGDASEMPLVEDTGQERATRKRVIPYVTDRRNILVLHLAEALPHNAALSVMYALERGIEAEFELEDVELTSELLPPDEGPNDRMLFTEAAEGGAGVLRQLQSVPENLARAARK